MHTIAHMVNNPYRYLLSLLNDLITFHIFSTRCELLSFFVNLLFGNSSWSAMLSGVPKY